MKKNLILCLLPLSLLVSALTGCSSVSLKEEKPLMKVAASSEPEPIPFRLPGSANGIAKNVVGPTAAIMLPPLNTRLVYETHSRTNILGEIRNIYYEYFMESPIVISYKNQNVPAAFMIRRLNDGRSISEVRLLFAITEGQCSLNGGRIIELNPNDFTEKSDQLPWTLNILVPTMRAFYERTVYTQNVLGTEICSGYSPEFLDYRLEQDKKNKSISEKMYIAPNAPPAVLEN